MSEKQSEFVSLALRMTPEERSLIKADAKALGLTPARYVVMVCKLLNESAREIATQDFVSSLTKQVKKNMLG